MVTIESALQMINQCGGALDTDTGRLNIPARVLEKAEIKKAIKILKKAGPEKVKAVLASVQAYCQACPYHDTGPTPAGKGVLHWCGPWKESNGDMRWFNIAELTACPLEKWGSSSTVH